MQRAISIVLLIVATLSGALCLTTPVIAAGAPTIEGNAVNGTAGGDPVAGLGITLTTYINSVPSGQQTTVTDTQGNYQFSNLSTDANCSYDLNANYKGVQYTSDFIQLTAGNATRSANLTVWETTNSDAAIQISAGNMMIVPFDPGVLNVQEIWAFNNTGDRVYVGAEGDATQTTAHFTLLSTAMEFIADPGISFNETTGIVTGTMPIFPGSESIGFSYKLSYQGSDAVINRKMDYATSAFSIFALQNGVVAKSTTLTQSPFRDIQGSNYLNFTGSSLKSGQEVGIALTVSPSVFTAPSPTNSIPWRWVLVVVMALGFVSIVYLRLKRQWVH